VGRAPAVRRLGRLDGRRSSGRRRSSCCRRGGSGLLLLPFQLVGASLSLRFERSFDDRQRLGLARLLLGGKLAREARLAPRLDRGAPNLEPGALSSVGSKKSASRKP